MPFRYVVAALALLVSVPAIALADETCFGLDMKPGWEYQLVIDEFGIVTPTDETRMMFNESDTRITITKSYYEDEVMPGASGTFHSCTNAQAFVDASKQEVSEITKAVNESPFGKAFLKALEMMNRKLEAAIDD